LMWELMLGTDLFVRLFLFCYGVSFCCSGWASPGLKWSSCLSLLTSWD
jgi:hypothetical protein